MRSEAAVELRQRAASLRRRAAAPFTEPFALLALAATAASVAVVVIETGGVVENPDGFAALTVWGSVVFVAAGLYVGTWRPGNRLGALLVLDGFAVAAQGLQGSSHAAVFAVGLLADAPTVLLIVFVLLAFPSGRLTRAGRIAFWALTAYFALVYVPRLLVLDTVSGGSPAAKCGDGCPENPLQVVSSPAANDVFHYLLPLGRLAAMGAVLVVLGLQFARASRPRRETLTPVVALGGTWLALVAVYGAVVTFSGSESDLTANVGFGVVISRAMLPAAFLLAPLQARATAGLALQRILRRFERAPTLLARERVLAQALDDQRLRLALWLPQSEEYVDATGVPLARPLPETGLVWTSFTRNGGPFAALVHSASLNEDPELVRAAGQALTLALSSRRLEADLERSVSELQRSRRLLLDADAADRRRLERDLHANAQQHLVALRIGLELARERADASAAVAERLEALRGQLDLALADLRRVASDIYSPLLEEAGLTAALRDAARRSQQPVRLELDEIGRLPPEVEAAVYVAVRETLVAALPIGAEAPPQLRLARTDGAVRFDLVVSGDGVPAADEATLRGVAARLAAVGGSLRIAAVPGEGTIVSGSVPLSRPVTGTPAKGGAP